MQRDRRVRARRSKWQDATRIARSAPAAPLRSADGSAWLPYPL